MPQSVWLWIIFLGIVFAMLALDLGVINRNDHEVKTKEALTWTGIWIACALLFNVAVYFTYEHHWFGIGTSVCHARRRRRWGNVIPLAQCVIPLHGRDRPRDAGS